MLRNAFEEWSARTGQTRADAARGMGVNKDTFSRWIAGVHKPRPVAMKALAELLGLDPVAVLREFQKRENDRGAA